MFSSFGDRFGYQEPSDSVETVSNFFFLSTYRTGIPYLYAGYDCHVHVFFSFRFYLDVKQNKRGKFIKVAEIAADGRRFRDV